MNEHLDINEIGILHNLRVRPEFNGREVRVIGGLEWRIGFNHRTYQTQRQFAYRCEMPGWPRKIIVEPHQLRKRRPPPDWVKLCNLHDIPREVTHV